MRGRDDNLYGVAESLGGPAGFGVIFRLAPDGTGYTVLHSFNCSSTEGGTPFGTLTEGPDGALYGVTVPNFHGATIQNVHVDCSQGNVFKINKDGSGFTVLASLNWFSTGAFQYGPVVVGQDGSVYGTTQDSEPTLAPAHLLGTVFKVDPAGVLTFPHVFTGVDGAHPWTGLTRGADGAMYGTTAEGGTLNAGTIFRITEQGAFSTLYSFDPTIGSIYDPIAPLLGGGDGKLYGIAHASGYTTVVSGTTTGAVVASSGGLSIGQTITINEQGGATPGSYDRLLTNIVGGTSLTWTPALPSAVAVGDTIQLGLGGSYIFDPASPVGS
jgi:uncharacterized repeat protein (TIGR03803 family)